MQKPITEGVAAVAQAVKGGGGAVTKVVAAQRKVVDKVDKPKPETVIVISSDEKTEKSRHVSRREGFSRKSVKTLTSILSARSKVLYIDISSEELIAFFFSCCLLLVD